MIATDALAIIHMLVNEDIAVVVRVFHLALSHHSKRAMNTRPEFDFIISKRMILDGACINTDWRAFMTRAAVWMPY